VVLHGFGRPSRLEGRTWMGCRLRSPFLVKTTSRMVFSISCQILTMSPVSTNVTPTLA
jgi:hypothetical protein